MSTVESECDFEERFLNEPVTEINNIVVDHEKCCQLKVAEDFIRTPNNNFGDKGPEEIDYEKTNLTVFKQQEFMNRYYDAYEELIND